MRLETFNDKLTFFAGAFAAWTILFLFVNFNLELPSKLGKRKINDIKNRTVSIVHGLFALFVSGYHIYRDNPQYAEPASNIQHIIMLTSCAYFMYDFIACAYYGLIDTGLILHHGMCLLGIGSCELTNNATTALIGLFLAEVSNFPMHFRCILRTFKMRYTKLYEFSEIMYIVTYIIARGICITYLVVTAIPVSETPIVIRLTCLGLWVQSLYFIYEMSGIMQRKVNNYNERCQKGISYNWFGDNERINELSYYRNEGSDKIF
jgi:hypothetical protein